MTTIINGLHHITAITDNAAATGQFFSKVLGLRLVKRTVSEDDTAGYHICFGNKAGDDGTLLTFFPREHSDAGRIGAGQATIIQLSIPGGALRFWRTRLRQNNCNHIVDETLFGDDRALFQFPSGLLVAFVECESDDRTPWPTEDVDSDVAIRGLYGITLAQQSTAHLPTLLTQTFGYVETDVEQITTTTQQRFVLPNSDAGVIDVQIDPNMIRGRQGTGTIHHFALSVGSPAEQLEMRQALIDAGMQVTDVIDLQYFTTVRARTPGGILIEIATTHNRGFTIDEPIERLGEDLCLPPDLEHKRPEIESKLPPLL
ncbi:MAG: VOC family protein [Pseudomonadota bacterium]